jgi:hypothetical protein
MPPIVNDIINFMSTPSFDLLKMGVLVYLGLLWLSIIIWVTRDSINRSNSLLFQTFSILLNILIPILGVPLYLIIRPGKTLLERYYEDMEHRILMEESDAGTDEEDKAAEKKQVKRKRAIQPIKAEK